MTDFLSSVLAEQGPVEKPLTVDGKTGPVWCRRITAGERQQMLRGQKVTQRIGAAATVEIDLAQNEVSQQHLVLFSICADAGGKPRFRKLEEVQALPAHICKALYALASEVNAEESDAGKDSPTPHTPADSAG